MANGKDVSKSADNSDQHARFLQTARALACDEDEAAFDEKLKAVVGPKKGKEEKAIFKSDD